MPTKHARCSASAAYRWINCPGSVALSDQCPDPGSSSYADEGTVAHSLAELKLRHVLHEITDAQYKKRLAKIQQDDYYNGEMDEATDFYVETVLEEFAAAGEGAELMIEQRLDLSQWIPEGFGTSDAVIIGGSMIQVIDLKYGKGIKVEAKNNPQFRLYGLGAVSLFGDLYDFDTVKTTVVQPRLDHVDSEVVILKELLLWGEEEVAPRAIMAMEGSDYFVAGDWCRFCRRRLAAASVRVQPGYGPDGVPEAPTALQRGDRRSAGQGRAPEEVGRGGQCLRSGAGPGR